MKIIMKAITKILIIKILSDGMKKKEKNKRLWVEWENKAGKRENDFILDTVRNENKVDQKISVLKWRKNTLDDLHYIIIEINSNNWN